MVVPNAILAIYYAARHRPEVAFSSQVGDGHICVPLCIGIFAIVHPIELSRLLITGCLFLLASSLLHLTMVATMKRLPRYAGAALLALYGAFLYVGILG